MKNEQSNCQLTFSLPSLRCWHGLYLDCWEAFVYVQTTDLLGGSITAIHSCYSSKALHASQNVAVSWSKYSLIFAAALIPSIVQTSCGMLGTAYLQVTSHLLVLRDKSLAVATAGYEELNLCAHRGGVRLSNARRKTAHALDVAGVLTVSPRQGHQIRLSPSQMCR
jgi:hypothetical protein